ncbi:hypothetical protein KCP77_09695 [Salmonella enterica subsp. enterica]|nr:hypothetical protein KCP77_09695 [Salmonella enterica subsp. enterica]
MPVSDDLDGRRGTRILAQGRWLRDRFDDSRNVRIRPVVVHRRASHVAIGFDSLLRLNDADERADRLVKYDDRLARH